MSSAKRLLSVLRLFSRDKPVWSVEEAAGALAISTSTAYRYFASLGVAGLLDPVSGAGYRLGPAIIELDYQIRACDPMLRAARPVMRVLRDAAGEERVVILCRLFRERVMCVHEEAGPVPLPGISYERGRPMSMLRGATSKIILPYLPRRALKCVFDEHRHEIEGAGLGADWPQFRAGLRELRRRGHCVTRGEVDPERVGIAAPVFNGGRNVVGSLSVVGMAGGLSRPDEARLTALTVAAAAEISAGLAERDEAAAPFGPRAVA